MQPNRSVHFSILRLLPTYLLRAAQDMLDMCVPNHHNHDQVLSPAESRSYFSTCAIQTSPLILGNDLSSMNQECLDVISNAEIIALNQDARVSRAKLVYQWPMAEWPNAKSLPGSSSSDGPTAAVMVVKDASVNISLQAWSKPLADGSVGVVAFNRGPTVASVNVTWRMIGLVGGVVAGVRDLWAHAECSCLTAARSHHHVLAKLPLELLLLISW